MTAQLIIGYAALWATLMKALLARARVIPGQCARCGRVFERRQLGQTICTCNRA